MSWEKGRPTGRCTVCGHPERTRIELLLAGGAGQKSVGDKFGLSKDSLKNNISVDVQGSHFVDDPLMLHGPRPSSAQGIGA